jgi:hypothetical protein
MAEEKQNPQETQDPNAPQAMHMPVSWWSQVISTLDRKIEGMSKITGFGEITLQLIMREGVIRDIVFKDEVTLRQKNNPTSKGSTLTENIKK